MPARVPASVMSRKDGVLSSPRSVACQLSGAVPAAVAATVGGLVSGAGLAMSLLLGVGIFFLLITSLAQLIFQGLLSGGGRGGGGFGGGSGGGYSGGGGGFGGGGASGSW